MTKDRLVESLRSYLSAPITTEEQVLYVLVGARKLLELSESENKSPAVKFISDWAVHSVIDRNSWNKESLLFLDGLLAQNRSWPELTPGEQTRLLDIIGLEAIRVDLMNLFRGESIPPVALGHPEGWCLFLQKFVSLVSGCPLRLKGGEYVEEVTIQMWPVPNSRNAFNLEWRFKRINSSAIFALAMNVYIEESDFHFGRGGPASDAAFESKLRALGYDFRLRGPDG
jgi:hypothetical protein